MQAILRFAGAKNLLIRFCLMVVMMSGWSVGWGQVSVQNFGTTTRTLTSQTGSTSFLPNTTTSGTTYARAGAISPAAPINLVTATNPLSTTDAYVRAVSSSSASVCKVTPSAGYTTGLEFYTSFKVLFGDAAASNSATSGIWTFYQGAGVNYTDNNDVGTTQVFTGLRFTFGASGALTLTYNNNGTYNSSGLTTSSFSQATVYTIEIVGNNKTSGTINYTYNGNAQSVAVQKFDLFINGTLVGNDLTKGTLPSNTSMNSTTFTGVSSASNVANLFLDDLIIYNSVPSVIGASAPSVTTSAATNLNTTSAQLNGNVTSDGGATITERGFVYKTSASVTIADNKTTVAGTTGTYNLIPTLSVNTQYYFRAYAINSVNTTLGSELNSWTLANTPNAPVVGGATPTSLTVAIGSGDGNPSTTIYAIQETTSGNYVQSNGSLGASPVYQTAVTWGSKTVTGLTNNTSYTFQVQAQNGAGTNTGFGSTASGTTSASAVAPSVITSAATVIDATSAQLNGNVTSDGGDAITERGFVYKTSAGVTIADNKTIVSGTTGAFSASPTLSVNTQYYFRAYAINSINTTLGSELNFWTLANTPLSPVVNGAAAGSLNVTIASGDGNPSTILYAIRENVVNNPSAKFVQADGTLGVSAVYQTDAVWGTITVTGLSANTGYGFAVSAQNGGGVNTSFGTNAATVFTLANTPVAPTVSGATGTSLNVAIGSGDNNPSTTVYAIQETTSGNYVQASGALGASAVYQTSSAWGTKTVTGLSNNTTYTFRVQAQNAASVNTAFGSTASGTTLNICGTEDFANITTTTPTTYATRTWTGTNGGTWTATRSRVDQNNANSPMVGVTTTPFGGVVTLEGSGSTPTITSPTSYTSGIGTLTFNYVRAFTGTSGRSFRVRINGTQIGTDVTVDPNSNTVATYSQLINISGNVILTIESVGTSQISFDNISWTCYSGPIATTTSATPSANGAVLNGTVNRNGSSGTITAGFEYGLTTSYGSGVITATTPTSGIITGSGDIAASLTISSLSVNTQYNYRIVASGATEGTRTGTNVSFWTLANVPTAPTVASPTSSSLNVTIGTGDGNPSTTTYAIQETGGNQYVQSNGSLGASAVWQTASAWGTKTVTGLNQNTSYTFQVKARNGANVETVFGNSSSGITGATAPTVTTVAASSILTTDATLNATINANGNNTTASFEYGTTISYGTSITATTPTSGLVTGSSNTSASVPISGLSVNTQYNFRAVASGGTGGTTNGSNLTFWTLANTPTTPTITNPTFSSNSLTVALGGSDGNPGANTTYAIRAIAQNQWVQANGTLGVSAVYQSAATWGSTITVTGLSPNTTYNFEVYARNGAAITTSASPSASGLTYAAATVISKQDFESPAGTPTLTYSVSGGAISSGTNTGGIPASNLFASGTRGYLLSNSTATLTFNNQSLNGYKNCYLTFRVAGMSYGVTNNGVETGDYVRVAISTDNGSTYSDEFNITGGLNNFWDFSAPGSSSTTYSGTNTPVTVTNNDNATARSTYQINIPDAVGQIRVRVTMLNSSTGEVWVIDDVNIFGTPLPATAPTGSSGDVTICNGNSTSLSISGGSQGSGTVEWYTGSCGGTSVGSGNNLSVSPTSTTTYYGAYKNSASYGNTLTNCQTIIVTVRPPFNTGSIPNTGQPICNNGDPAIIDGSTTPASGGDNSITYKWQANGVDIPSSNSASYDPPAGLTVTTTYIRFAKDNTCNTSFTQSTGSWVVTVANIWVGGNNSNDWNTAANWSCNAVPGINDPVIIPQGKTVVINSPNTIVIGGTLTMDAGTLSTLTVMPGAILRVTGTANLNSQSLVFKSTSAGDGMLGNSTGGTINYGATPNVTVERYLGSVNKRAWRLLTAPVSGSSNNSVFFNWQNNGASGVATSTGAEIWGPGGGNGLSAGPNYNLRSYNNNNQSFDNITNTTNTGSIPLFGGSGNNRTFYLFLSGPFGSGQITNQSAFSATTLRAKGSLLTGNQSFSISATANNYYFVSNPYASTVNHGNSDNTGNINTASYLLNITNATNTIYFWDPNLSGLFGVGGYVGFDRLNNTYSSLPSGYQDGASYTRMQSGQGFVLQAASTGTLSVNFTEASKGGASSPGIFRTTGGAVSEKIRVTLQRSSSSGFITMDGTAAFYYDNANAGVDAMDGNKLNNSSENLMFLRNGKSLTFEHRPTVSQNDTLFMGLTNTTATGYQFVIEGSDFSANAGLRAVLQDLYLNTETQLNLYGSTTVGFNVDANAASTGNNRFRIVLRPDAATSVRNADAEKWIKVYPNPVAKGQSIQLEMKNRTAGAYQMVLYNALGMRVHAVQFVHGGSATIQRIQLPGTVSAGVYVAEISDAKGNKEEIKITIQ